MAILTVTQTKNFASQAGFTGQGLNIIVAIAQAESGLNTAARGVNSDGSIDRGIVQINSKWHAEYSDACAYEPSCAMRAAYQISNKGTNFTPWSTYTSGAYKQFLSGGTSAASGKQWYDYPITNGYLTTQVPGNWDSPHYALDFGTPRGTPFFFLESGTITQADYAVWDGAPGGGEIFLKPDAASTQEYAYHLDQIVPGVSPGKHVKAGQIVGYTGGQNSGGNHPTSPKWSSGPHLHFGLFTKFIQTAIGSRPYGPDPGQQINLAKQFNITGSGDGTGPDTGTDQPVTNGVPLSEQVHDILIHFPGFSGIALALDKAEQFPGVIWYPTDSANPVDGIGNGIRSVLDTVVSNALPFFVRSMFVMLGLLLLIGLLWNLAQATGLADVALTAATEGAI
jgi:murein DD-endopeptidase MepM/ murein hydrolase activator NlpD